MRASRIAGLGVLVAFLPVFVDVFVALLDLPSFWLTLGGSIVAVAAYSAVTDPDDGRPTPGDDSPDVVTCPNCRAREVADRDDCRFCGEPL